MQEDTIAEFKGLYLKTAREYLASLKSDLGKAYGNNSAEVLQNLFMSAHSLKSQSLAMNYREIGTVARAMEIFFQSRINSHSSISHDEASSMQGLLRFIEDSLESIERDDKEKNSNKDENADLGKIQED